MKEGDKIRAGIVNIGINNKSTISITNGDSICVKLGKVSDLSQERNIPRVDLVLCVPRPRRLETLLPVISCIGVGTLVLLGASKVQKDYFGKYRSV